MTIKAAVREQVRQRANFACEFCGVSETDTGAELTVDHFQPVSEGGGDNFENLLYCCPRCNQYKADYWPTRSDEPQLWNPRLEPPSQHFLEFDDGTLHALTPTAAFALRRLRLNRPALVAHRLRKQQIADELRLLARYRDLVRLLEGLLAQQSALMEEQRALLKEQRELLQLLIDRR